MNTWLSPTSRAKPHLVGEHHHGHAVPLRAP